MRSYLVHILLFGAVRKKRVVYFAGAYVMSKSMQILCSTPNNPFTWYFNILTFVYTWTKTKTITKANECVRAVFLLWQINRRCLQYCHKTHPQKFVKEKLHIEEANCWTIYVAWRRHFPNHQMTVYVLITQNRHSWTRQ